MALLAIRIEQDDLDRLKEKAAELRIPFTIYARTLIVQGMKEETKIGELKS
jgi:predicted DNA binding CopG/RHH family protein